MTQTMVAGYQRASEVTASPRETELTAFAVVNRMLAAESGDRQRIKALGKNHELWSLLVKDLGHSSNALPAELKGQLVGLGIWSMGYSIKSICDPLLPVAPLIEVNRNIAEGLRSQVPTPAANAPVAANAAGNGYPRLDGRA